MRQDQLEDKMRALTDADMKGATVGGKAFPAQILKPSGWSFFGQSNPFRLMSLDPDKGTYIVVGGAAPSPVMDGTGRPLILNLRNPPGAVQAQQ
jgi:hypothetical protein